MQDTYDVICLVTNDITYDRRMLRVCQTLSDNGLKVMIMGRQLKTSVPLKSASFDQHRVGCIAHRGPLFYLEIAMRLAWEIRKLEFKKVLFIDLDTLLVSRLIQKGKRQFYIDLHEYFEEVPELSGKYFIKKVWRLIERIGISRCDYIYTVNESLANIFSKRYSREVGVIRNVPFLKSHQPRKLKFPLRSVYLGVLNPGRGLSLLIESIKHRTDIELVIIGDGPLYKSLEVVSEGADHISFTGAMKPDDIAPYLESAHIGWNLLDGSSQSYYYSLANKFFDYLMHGLPVITMDFPEYSKIIKEHKCGLMLPELTASAIGEAIDLVIEQPQTWEDMHASCQTACALYNWQVESQKLLEMYR